MNPISFPLAGSGLFESGLFVEASALLILSVAAKSFLLILVAFVVARFMRKRSAAAVHCVWTVGFCGCLVAPALALFPPAWSLAILPDWRSNSPIELRGEPVVDTSKFTASAGRFERGKGAEMKATDPNHASVSPAVSTPVETTLIATGNQASGQGPTPPPAGIEVPSADADVLSASGFSWPVGVLMIWTVGTLFCLLRTCGNRISLQRLLSRSSLVEDEDWKRAAVEACQALGFHRTIRLRLLAEARSPMVAGLFRVTVLLPEDAADWTPARRRLVLLHELAHVKRHDALTQAVAGLVCALQWFNPLCWFGLSRMRELRELACDDLVVACGQRPTEYAGVLLDVARSYRLESPAAAIGMARRANVESRLLALLDGARSHLPLSRRAARIQWIVAAAVVAVIGTSQLRSQPDAPAPPAADAGTSPKKTPNENSGKPGDEDADGLRGMEIMVRDANGAPIEGVNLRLGIWDLPGQREKREQPLPKDYRTDANGRATITIPRRLLILRLWPSKKGYVPQFKNFAKGTHDEGRRIPKRYEFVLAKATRIGGVVADGAGQPVAGVKVEVSVDVDSPVWAVETRPIVSRWLNGEKPVVTDAEGKWFIANAPAKLAGRDYRFRLKFTHGDYISDSRWGEQQEKQRLTTEMLRRGDAKMILQRGVSITGSVADYSGKPVTKGLVIWDDDPYLGDAAYETHIGKDGRFKTPPLRPGEYPVTVVAQGFKPELRKVKVGPSMPEVDFELPLGSWLSMKVVGPEGKPIPRAYVNVTGWRGLKSLYNHKHPNVPESGIPRHADAKGVYVWDWAPDDAVSYYVSAKGYNSSTVTLTPTPDGHVVQLTRPLMISGRVTDSATGKPVRKFNVIPVTEFRPNFLTTTFREQMPGRDGAYEFKMPVNSEREYHYRVRVEAAGYRSAIGGQKFARGDGKVTQDFSLEPVTAALGKVVDEDGNPAANAAVIEGSPSIIPHVSNNRLGWSERQLKTSGDGSFKLAASSEPVRIRVIHKAGFAEKLWEPGGAVGTIELQPWARVAGRLLHDGMPIADEVIHFYPVIRRQLGEARFQDSYYTKTDADGRFEFPQLPPIAGTIRASLGPWRPSLLTSSQAIPLDLRPGDNRTVTLGGEGVAVTGRVIATGRGNASLNKNWSLNYLIRRDQGIELPAEFPKLGFNPEEPVQASWFLEPGHYDWLATRQNHFVRLAPDGRLRISGVTPGAYDLIFRLYEQPVGCLVETIGQRVVTVTVTDADVATGGKDIGAVEIECRAGPRVGENMQLYKFTDTSGRERSIGDMRGQHVLMHVWASWCAPCIKSMPDLKATAKSLSDRPITFVGLNIDDNAKLAKARVLAGGWNWSQNYLGSDSDVARQLAISSVPTYFLIGPDGLLVASTVDWSEMKAKAQAALNPRF